MADIQNWRRMVHTTRPRQSHPRQGQVSQDTNGTDKSSQSRVETDRLRPRPRSRLASYLSTHRTSLSLEKLDAPSFDWSSTKDRDVVYNPDTDFMCSTILKRMLAFPSQEVPAAYNSFLLHILEAYRQLSLDKHDLQQRLDAEIQSQRGDVEKIRLATAALDEERRRDPRNAPEMDLSAGGKRGIAMLASAWRGRTVYCQRFDDETGRRAKREESLGVRARSLGPGSTTRQAWKRERPPSPSRGMARLSRRLLVIGHDAEVLSTSTFSPETVEVYQEHTTALGNNPGEQHYREVPFPNELSDSDISSVEGDLLPDEEEQTRGSHQRSSSTADLDIAVRLTNWLASRTGNEPEVLFPDIAELFLCNGLVKSDLDSKIRVVGVDKPLPGLPPQLDPDMAEIERNPVVRRPVSAENAPIKSNIDHVKVHRRGFSFMPGDDSNITIPVPRPRAFSVVGAEVAKDSALTQALAYDGEGHLSSPTSNMSLFEHLRSTTTSTPRNTHKSEDSVGNPHREDSARSVLTAFRDPSSHGSSTSQLRSTGGSGMAIKAGEAVRQPKDNVAAVAATSAAGHGNQDANQTDQPISSGRQHR